MTLLLIILLGILAWKYLIPYLIRRQLRKTFGYDPTSGPRRQTGNQQSRQPQQQPRPRSKKKIDPNIGEYVEFTETSETTTRQTSDGNTEIKTEQQITDVQWEDLP